MFAQLGGILYFTDQTIYQILLQLFNTMIMAFMLSKLMYKPVKEFMANRKNRISSMISTTETKLKEADNLKLMYDKKLQEIEIERNEILDNAKKRANEREKEIIESAKQEAMTIKNRSLTEIEREKEKAKDEMKTQIIDISSLIAGRFVKDSMNDEIQNKLFNEVVKDLGEVEWQI